MLDALGIDEICEMIIAGKFYREIARDLGITHWSVIEWVAADAERSRRVQESRRLSAQAFEEQAVEAITNAKDKLDLMKAKELAHHYRWKASKIAPKEYGDKLAVTDGEGNPLQAAAPVFNVTVRGK